MIKKLQILAFSLLLLSGAYPRAEEGGAQTPRPQAVQKTLQLPDFSSLVQDQGPAVVNVRVFRSRPNELAEAGGEPASKPLLPPRESGLGSGFVVTSNGVILTNRHVVANAEKIRVRFADKREFPAKVLGVDALTDVAVLKVDVQQLATVSLGDSSRLHVGEWVLAIGAPMGLERTATQGIISALGRTLPNDSYVSFIQTDVPINPGNSGGPLFNLEGQVVGINSQIVSNSGGYMGLSFAIPINMAMLVAKQILERGHATHGWLGVSTQELTLELAQAYGLESPRGALITEVNPLGPAEKAGIQMGDIILAMDDVDVTDSADLPPMIGASQPGSDHLLLVLRDSEKKRLNVRIGELGQDNTTNKRNVQVTPIKLLGLTVSDLNRATREVLNLRGGVLVEVAEDGPAFAAGVQAGDILLKLGRFPLNNATQLQDLCTKLPLGQVVPLLVKRQENASFVTILIPEKR